MTAAVEPPVILNSTRVLLYAETGGASAYTGRVTVSTGYRNDLREVGPVPRLAIAEDLGTGCVLIMHCDSEWNVLGVCRSSSIDAAKELCERGYVGVSSRWTEFRPLSIGETQKVEAERKVMQQLVRDYPLDGHDPFAA